MSRERTSAFLMLLAAAAVILVFVVAQSAAGTPASAAKTTYNAPAQAEHWQGSDADDDDPQIGRLAFLTIAVAGAAALVALVGYAVRRAVGYEPHRPGPDDEPPNH